MVRCLLNSITHFCPTSINPINALDIIDTDVFTAHYYAPASSALPLLSQSLVTQTSVAVVGVDGKLIGEISPLVLNAYEEPICAAIMTLSVGDLMVNMDCGGPPEDLAQLIKERLLERNLDPALELMEEDSGISLSSLDDEVCVGKTTRLGRSSRANVCYPWSSLVAVMIQALSRRANYVWVVEEDRTLAGIVTFARMMKIFQNI
ncbi:hypothetical protein SLE2022_012240 [Rubroshorea leprosula]